MKKIRGLNFLGLLFFASEIFTSNHFDPNQNIQTVSEKNQRIQELSVKCKDSTREESEQTIALSNYNKMKELKKRKQESQKINFENNKK